MEKTIIKMTSVLEMVGFLKANGTQCRFVGLTCDTPVTDLRVGCPWRGNLRKVSKKVGLINVNYNASVCRRIAAQLGMKESEVEYVNGDVWHRHLTIMVDGNEKRLPLLVNKKSPDNGKYYVQYFPHSSEHKYVMTSTGTVIPDEAVEYYQYPSADQPDWKPTTRSISLDNIREFRASGVIIQMPDFEEAAALFA